MPGTEGISLDEFAGLIPGFLYQLERNPEGLFRFRYISAGVQRILGVPVAEALENAEAVMGLIHPEDVERIIEESMKSARAQRSWNGEFRIFSRQGKMMWFEAQDAPQTGTDGTILWTGYANDVSEKKALEQKILDFSRLDALTGLLNRQTFLENVENALKPARRNRDRFALLFVDLDKFKPVNDGFGHATGDQLLRAVAGRLRESLRESDIVGRYGGDEFVVLLADTAGAGEAVGVARKINAALALPFELPEGRFDISASVGVAFFPEHGSTADQLVESADQAMYRAKNAGAGGFRVFTPDGGDG